MSAFAVQTIHPISTTNARVHHPPAKGAEASVLVRPVAALTEVAERAEEGIIITDIAGTITYVNAAYARRCGYTRPELVGQNPRLLKSGLHSAAFYERMWKRLRAGEAFSGVFVNRRPDGALVRDATIISPYRDADGAVAGYIGIKRTLDGGQSVAKAVARERADRAAVVAALSSLQPADDVVGTATRICDRIVSLPSIRLAAVIVFDEEGALPLVTRSPDGPVPRVPKWLPAGDATGLRELTLGGAWVHQLDPADERTFTAPARALGVTTFGAAPLRTNGGLPAVLLVGSRAGNVQVADRLLPALSEFGAIASALLCDGLERRSRLRVGRRRLLSVIRRKAFEPAFQPIVELATGVVVGYELLTRFADGVPPDERFAEARTLGLSGQLELATLRRGLQVARHLDPSAWISVNVGPDLLANSTAMRHLIASMDREVILELTEHEVVTDYARIRDVARALGPRVSLAVDDAGAGYASMRHILELHPSTIKVDLGIVRGIDGDPARQALVAGLQFFAEQVGCIVVAEGIETEAERATLAKLGVGHGQGYFFGRPRPIDEMAA